MILTFLMTISASPQDFARTYRACGSALGRTFIQMPVNNKPLHMTLVDKRPAAQIKRDEYVSVKTKEQDGTLFFRMTEAGKRIDYAPLITYQYPCGISYQEHVRHVASWCRTYVNICIAWCYSYIMPQSHAVSAAQTRIDPDLSFADKSLSNMWETYRENRRQADASTATVDRLIRLDRENNKHWYTS